MWSDINGHKVNTITFTAILFRPTNKPRLTNNTIRLGGLPSESVNQHEFLGEITVNYFLAKISRVVNILAHCHIASPLSIKLKIDSGSFLSHLNYCHYISNLEHITAK